jgi:glutaredoxin
LIKTGLFRVAACSAFLAYLAVLAYPAASADTLPETGEAVTIYFFWGDGCPHCAQAKPFLEDLSRQYPQVKVQAYEVYYVQENRALLAQMAAAFGFEARAVPTIFIGERYWQGYNQTIAGQIQAYVETCLSSACPDAGRRIITPAGPLVVAPESPAEAESATAETATTERSAEAEAAAEVIDVPLLGAVDLSARSLTVSTAIIAFVDGFNPCSLWVLSILLALTLHTGSRKKVLIIGLIFISVTAGVYALFIAGLFTVFTFVSFLGWIQVVVALVALFFALVNIKDYFWYQEGLSFTIADEKKPGIYQRARKILNASDSLWGLVSATIVMAAGVSVVEFSCTAGFPVLWTNILTAQKASSATFAALLVLYMVIYQIDELGIFMAAVVTLRASRLEEKHGRVLKLVGGLLMLTLAVVMIVDPALMNSLGNSLLIFANAFGLAMIVLFVHREVLPRFGVYIGTEMAPRRAKKRRTSRKKKRAS